MAIDFKKGLPLENKIGRPVQGSLYSYSEQLRKDVKEIREKHAGWGAPSILLELEEKYDYNRKGLPSTASINRYLKEQGLVESRLKFSPLPQSNKNKCKKSRRSHDQWEMDAKGPHAVLGMSTCAPINIKDQKSKIHCMSFPVPVKNKRSQPSTIYYYWALRLAFNQWGLPKSISVDHDSVFYENNTNSPFPKHIHLWLIGLGVEFCFIKHKPPKENAMIERSHQTIRNQIYKGQQHDCWKSLFQYTLLRLDKLNTKLPNRSLGGKSPLKRFPKAIHSGRKYSIEQEAELIDFKRIYSFLAKGKWYRKVSNSKTISLGRKIYYLKNAKPLSQLQITFCNRRKKLLFHDVNEHLVEIQPVKALSLKDLMGGSTKDLISMKYKLFQRKKCPLIT